MREESPQLHKDGNRQLGRQLGRIVSKAKELATQFDPQIEDNTPVIRRIVEDATGIGRPNRKPPGLPIPLLIFAVVCLSAGILLIWNWRGKSAFGWLCMAVFILICLVIGNVRTQGLSWIYGRLRRAEYEEALRRADLLLRWFPGISLFHDLRGSVLRYSGRSEEAEQAFRVSIEMGQVKPGLDQALRLENLGEVLLDMGRFTEATTAFEASSKIYPRHSGASNGQAEVWLRQCRDPRRALLLVETALQLKQSNAQTRDLDRHNLANMWANRAQALAMMGRKDEAAVAIANACSVGDPEFIPGLAGTCWRCGVALRLLELEQAALEQFQKASQIDRGLYGRFAASAMQEQHAHH